MSSTSKQLSPVLLPNEEWVSHWQVTRAISNAFHPDLRNTAGVSLVTHKSPSNRIVPGLQSRLTHEDRLILERVADLIPPIKLGMTGSEWKKVIRAFAAVTKSYSIGWTPCKPDEVQLYLDYTDGAGLRDEHRAAMSDLVRSGCMSARNSRRVPVTSLAIDTEMARRDVEAYLESAGIAFTTSSRVSRPEIRQPLRQLEPMKWDAPIEFSPDQRGRDPQGRWTPAGKTEMRKLRDSGKTLEELGRLYGCTESRIRQLLADADDPPSAGRPKAKNKRAAKPSSLWPKP